MRQRKRRNIMVDICTISIIVNVSGTRTEYSGVSELKLHLHENMFVYLDKKSVALELERLLDEAMEEYYDKNKES